MWFTRISIANPVLATMVMLAFVVLGLFAVNRLKVDQFPNVEFPFVVVSTEYPGASPEVVEIEVTRKIEEASNTVAGINQIFSRSYEGMSVVIVQFNLDYGRAQLPNGFSIPRHSRLHTQPVGDLPCRFRTGYRTSDAGDQVIDDT